MSLKGISLGEIVDFISKKDAVAENPTKFKLGVLDSFSRAGLYDMFEKDALGRPKNEWKYCIDVVRFGLKGIENFDVEFKTIKINRWGQEYEVVDNDVLRRIPSSVINELADEILKNNILTELERKN